MKDFSLVVPMSVRRLFFFSIAKMNEVRIRKGLEHKTKKKLFKLFNRLLYFGFSFFPLAWPPFSNFFLQRYLLPSYYYWLSFLSSIDLCLCAFKIYFRDEFIVFVSSISVAKK